MFHLYLKLHLCLSFLRCWYLFADYYFAVLKNHICIWICPWDCVPAVLDDHCFGPMLQHCIWIHSKICICICPTWDFAPSVFADRFFVPMLQHCIHNEICICICSTWDCAPSVFADRCFDPMYVLCMFIPIRTAVVWGGTFHCHRPKHQSDIATQFKVNISDKTFLVSPWWLKIPRHFKHTV